MRTLRLGLVTDSIGFQEVYSLPIISAIAKQGGHVVELFEFRPHTHRVIKRIAAFNPDIVGYSVSSNENQRYLTINSQLKARLKFFSLFGGPHPTFFPQYIENEGVDAVCCGEADRCLPELLERFGTDRMYEVSNFSFKLPDRTIRTNPVSDLVEDLDSLPLVDRDLLYSRSSFLARTPIKGFFSGRGCPYNCSYCFNHAYRELYRGKGKLIRQRSVGHFLGEIQQVQAKWPLKLVRIMDDTFGLNAAWLDEFTDRYPREIGLPFTCQARPNLLTDDYCRHLKRGGCHSVFLAVECSNEELRKSVANRNVTNQEIVSACQNLKRHGIRIGTYNMIGLPGETEQDMLQTAEMNHRMGVDYAEVSIMQPYPGTKINEYCRQAGYLSDDVKTFGGQYSDSVLNFGAGFKHMIYVIHKLFPMIVDHPRLRALLPSLYKTRSLDRALDLLYRTYYGIHMHRRLYGSKIPLALRARQSFRFLFAPSRS